ncbi:MAG: methyl-accepting chemotaxis protein [Myxococcales bacterium]
MMLTNMKIVWRLVLGFGVLLAIMAAVSIATYAKVSSVEVATKELAREGRMTVVAARAVADIDQIVIQVAGIVAQRDLAKKKEALNTIAEHRGELGESLRELRESTRTDEGKARLRDVENAIAGLRQADDKALEESLAGRDAEALVLFEQVVKPANRQLAKAIDDYLGFLGIRQKAVQEDAVRDVASTQSTVVVGALLMLLLAVGSALVITRSITKPIHHFGLVLKDLAKGDLTVEIDAEALSRKDELGDVSRAAQTMIDALRKLVGDISTGVQTLAASSTELSTIASQTTGGVQTMRSRATTVAAAAEEASANTLSVASGMKQASTSLSSVASATEQMSAAIAEVAHNAAKARTISEQATAQGEVVSTTMKELGEAARQIGKVTETITDISSQTNLLALNATIEAARAGTAGKGFAVVANEIKELARQTAAATEDIKTKISGVQSSTGGAIADIEKITGVVRDVGGLVNSIAASIEEQAAVTKDVARNISQATTGVSDSNSRVEQTATVSKTIAQDIAGVNSAAVEIDQGGAQVAASAASLSKLAEQLRGLTAQFRM